MVWQTDNLHICIHTARCSSAVTSPCGQGCDICSLHRIYKVDKSMTGVFFSRVQALHTCMQRVVQFELERNSNN